MLGRFAAVDIDVKADRSGVDAWRAWRAENGQYLPTWITPSGGAHVLFKLPEGTDSARLRQSPLAPGIDIRAAFRSYVLCPPSRIGDGRYLLTNPQIYEAPEALLRHVLPERTALTIATPTAGEYDPADVAALLNWLNERGEAPR